MNILIKQAKLIDRKSSFHNIVVDILIESGSISAIGNNISVDALVDILEAENLHVSAGWFDMRANFREPGTEYLEGFTTGCEAAAHGGFTGVALSPETTPVTDHKSQVEFINRFSENNLVDLVPTGALSKQLEGKELAEMYDMHLAGARGFYNGKENEVSAALMQKALLYTKQMNEVVINHPLDKSISGNAEVHEGKISTTLGLKGIPAIAEEIRLNRDIYLAEYTEGKLHVAAISTKGSTELIAKAKSKNIQISCDIVANQLLFTDEQLTEFDSQYKVLPPYRSEADRLALIDALQDNTIEIICSDHSPWDDDHKKLEFKYAEYGNSSLETCFLAANTALKDKLLPEDLVDKLSTNPRAILGLENISVEKGQKANLTLFSPVGETAITKDYLKSKGKNTPFLGKSLTGQVLGVINNNQYSWFKED